MPAGATIDDMMGRFPPESYGDKLSAKVSEKAKEIVAAVAKAAGDSSLTIDQRKLVARAAKKSLKALRGEWRLCRSRLKAIIKHFKKQGTLETLGLAGLANDVAAEEKVARCKAKLRAIREIACKKKQ